jgi:hypothetical protein
VSPAALLFALVLFPLLWVEIRCDRPIEGTRTLVEQSGLQAAYGGYSQKPPLERARTELARQQSQTQADQDRELMSAAPLLFLYIGLVVTSLVLWFKTERALLRPAGLTACSGAALFVLILQLQRGFPLERAMNAPAIRAMITQPTVFGILGATGLAESHYTVWFWLTIAMVVTSLIAALIDCWLVIRPQARSFGRFSR